MSSKLVTKILPKKIDLKKLCQSHTQLQGDLALMQFHRLQHLIQEMELSEEQVHCLTGEAQLNFSLGEKNQRLIEGKVIIQLPARCQRCLEQFTLALEVPIRLVQWSASLPTKDEWLPEDFDWLVYEEDSISLAALLEDDLLLGIPVAPSHEEEACNLELLKQFTLQDTPEAPNEVESSQFFQVLSLLKQKE